MKESNAREQKSIQASKGKATIAAALDQINEKSCFECFVEFLTCPSMWMD